jgi:hypothetical protein
MKKRKTNQVPERKPSKHYIRKKTNKKKIQVTDETSTTLSRT